MGDLLFLAHRIPWPPDKGDKIRSWHLLKHLLDRGWRVHLGAFVDDPADFAFGSPLMRFGRSIRTIPVQPSVLILISIGCRHLIERLEANRLAGSQRVRRAALAFPGGLLPHLHGALKILFLVLGQRCAALPLAQISSRDIEIDFFVALNRWWRRLFKSLVCFLTPTIE